MIQRSLFQPEPRLSRPAQDRADAILKLSEAAAQLGIEPGTHRALADTEATRRIVLKMSEEER